MRLSTAFEPHCRSRGHGLDNARGEIGGVWTGESEATEAVDSTRGLEQIGKVVIAIVVAVDRLPEKSDLAGPLLYQRPHFGDHIRKPAAAFRTAGIGDDAEGAPIITAPLYRYESGGALLPQWRNVLIVLPRPELGVTHPLAGIRQPDQLGKIAIRVRPNHQIDAGNLSQQRRSQALGHTAHDTQDVTLSFVAL
jgi:hypothetical protein